MGGMPGMSTVQHSAGRLTPGENRQVPIELQDFYKSNPHVMWYSLYIQAQPELRRTGDVCDPQAVIPAKTLCEDSLALGESFLFFLSQERLHEAWQLLVLCSPGKKIPPSSPPLFFFKQLLSHFLSSAKCLETPTLPCGAWHKVTGCQGAAPGCLIPESHHFSHFGSPFFSATPLVWPPSPNLCGR